MSYVYATHSLVDLLCVLCIRYTLLSRPIMCLMYMLHTPNGPIMCLMYTLHILSRPIMCLMYTLHTPKQAY